MPNLPSKFTQMGSLVKKNDEHPYDFLEKIRYYCSYRSNVLRDKIYDTPDRISAMIVHFLPEEPPYMAIKERFSDFYLPGDVPNYYKYKNYYGQWYPDYAYLTNYIVRVERAHYNQKVPLLLHQGVIKQRMENNKREIVQ